MSVENLCDIYRIYKQGSFADKDIKRSFERACNPYDVSELLGEYGELVDELEDLRAYKDLAIEMANRKGFNSVADAIDSIELKMPSMEPLTSHIKTHYNSLYDAAKQNRCNETTLRSYARTGALVDENGQVWVKGKIKLGEK